MKKFTKRIAMLAAIAMMSIGAAGVSASAEVSPTSNVTSTSSGDIGYVYNESYMQAVNLTNTYRYIEAHINVYNKSTGAYVAGFSGTKRGGYNAYAEAYNNNYSSNNYDIYVWGDLYNSGAPESGIYISTGMMKA